LTDGVGCTLGLIVAVAVTVPAGVAVAVATVVPDGVVVAAVGAVVAVIANGVAPAGVVGVDVATSGIVGVRAIPGTAVGGGVNVGGTVCVARLGGIVGSVIIRRVGDASGRTESVGVDGVDATLLLLVGVNISTVISGGNVGKISVLVMPCGESVLVPITVCKGEFKGLIGTTTETAPVALIGATASVCVRARVV
jgi:hypothetical protein